METRRSLEEGFVELQTTLPKPRFHFLLPQNHNRVIHSQLLLLRRFGLVETVEGLGERLLRLPSEGSKGVAEESAKFLILGQLFSLLLPLQLPYPQVGPSVELPLLCLQQLTS